MTRMWMIDPRLLCSQHLLGEHNEIHKALGNMRRGRSIEKYLEWGLLDPKLMCARHRVLIKEFLRRDYPSGILHKTPITKEDLKAISKYPRGCINLKKNIKDLIERCSRCRERILAEKHVINSMFGKTAVCIIR